MNADIALAVGNLTVATARLERIVALPEEVGSVVTWGHNGLQWTRVSGDAWVPTLEDMGGRTWSSEHIASMAVTA